MVPYRDIVAPATPELAYAFALDVHISLANLSANAENAVGTNSHAGALLNTKKEIGRRYMIIIHERNDNILFY